MVELFFFLDRRRATPCHKQMPNKMNNAKNEDQEEVCLLHAGVLNPGLGA